MRQDDDKNFDPMIYDVLREMETRIGGRYNAWADNASTPEEERHWLDEAEKVFRQVRAVDHNSRSAIEAKRAELRELWATMPGEAPDFTP